MGAKREEVGRRVDKKRNLERYGEGKYKESNHLNLRSDVLVKRLNRLNRNPPRPQGQDHEKRRILLNNDSLINCHLWY